MYNSSNILDILLSEIKLDYWSKSITYTIPEFNDKHNVNIVIKFTKSGWDRLLNIISHYEFTQNNVWTASLLHDIAPT